jgi:epsilon-lactone hydrolase
VFCCICTQPPPAILPSWNVEFDLLVNSLRDTFKVQVPLTKRNIKLIRAADKRGTPHRKLPKDVVAKMGDQTIKTVDGYDILFEWVHPKNMTTPVFPLSKSEINRQFLVYFHGGGFVLGTAETSRPLTTKLAEDLQTTVMVIEYRLAPEYPYPIPEEDCFTSYLWLLQREVDPRNIFFAGDSAGGALIIGTLVRARNAGYPMPRGIILMSPWVDIFDMSRDSFTRNVNYDVINPHLPDQYAPLYIDPRNDNFSAIKQDLRGLPPMLIEYGECELLVDQIDDFIEVARQAGVNVTAHKYSEMVHVFQIFFFTGQPQCQESFDAMKVFVENMSNESVEYKVREEKVGLEEPPQVGISGSGIREI